MEKSWIFWNFGKSHEILTKKGRSWKSHGIFKMEQKVMEKSWNFTNEFLIHMNRRRYPAALQKATDVYVD